MLHGKYWILPYGGLIDVTSGEHKIEARQHMFFKADKLPKAAMFDFVYVPTEKECARFLKDGMPEECIKCLVHGNDERLYAMRYWGWVRVARHTWNAHRLDKSTLDAIQANSEYWSEQNRIEPGDAVDFLETSTWIEYQIPVKWLRQPHSAAAIQKALAEFRKDK